MRNTLLNLTCLDPSTAVGRSQIRQLLNDEDVDPILIDWIFEAIEKARAVGHIAGYEEGHAEGYHDAEEDMREGALA